MCITVVRMEFIIQPDIGRSTNNEHWHFEIFQQQLTFLMLHIFSYVRVYTPQMIQVHM